MLNEKFNGNKVRNVLSEAEFTTTKGYRKAFKVIRTVLSINFNNNKFYIKRE